MEKNLEYYLNLNYPIEVYPGEHEVGDAYLAIYSDFDIKGASEDYEEAIEIAREYLIKHIKKQLELGKELPKPGEGVRFMSHREALSAYRAKDYEKAMNIWLEEVKHKSDQAMTNIGLMYLKGEGVDKDYDKARKWFEDASEYDNDSANYNLALMYQTKIGVEEDVEKAIEYFRRAVAKNHQGASFRLGLLLLKDRTLIEQVKEGFDAMLKATKSGHPMALAQMGGVSDTVNTDCEKNHIFRANDMEKQLEVINDAIERYIRPILIKDGGDITILEYINEPEIELRLAYLGNCAGCSLGATSTYELIKGTLSQVIDENIRIYII
jgi:Fe-S cluster biogenesis protein NfuA